jgi:rhodanese-related sulfurtransferase
LTKERSALHSFFYVLYIPTFALRNKDPYFFIGWPTRMKHITTFELKEKMERTESFQLIDTREPDKYAECHIEGALNIPQIDLPDMGHLVAKDKPVIIYCLYGVKSQAPYLYLTEKMKFKNIYVLEGGIYQWAADIDPSLPIA